MKRWHSITLAVLIFAFLIFMVYQPVIEWSTAVSKTAEQSSADSGSRNLERTVSFCSDVWPPYVNEPGSPREGYVVDLLRKIYPPPNFNVQLLIVPWSRCLNDVRDGRITAVIGTDTEEASGFIFPTALMGVYRPLFYTLPGSDWLYNGTNSLRDIRLGVAQDYSYSRELDAYIEEFQETHALLFGKGEMPLNTLLRALREKRIETFVENEFTVNSFLGNRQERKELLRIAGPLQTDERIFIAFSPSDKQSSSLAKRYDRGIDELRRSGTLASILDDYSLNDWLVSPHVRSSRGHSGGGQP